MRRRQNAEEIPTAKQVKQAFLHVVDEVKSLAREHKKFLESKRKEFHKLQEQKIKLLDDLHAKLERLVEDDVLDEDIVSELFVSTENLGGAIEDAYSPSEEYGEESFFELLETRNFWGE